MKLNKNQIKKQFIIILFLIQKKFNFSTNIYLRDFVIFLSKLHLF